MGGDSLHEGGGAKSNNFSRPYSPEGGGGGGGGYGGVPPTSSDGGVGRGFGSMSPGSPEAGGGRGGEGGRLSRAVSGHAFGDSGSLAWATGTLSGTAGSGCTSGGGGGGGGGGGLKRARDRRADRRRKKDPFEALEERLLDGFSLESITRQLEREDETLQKGVRRVQRWGVPR